jgi:hypothetical protein
MKCISIPECTQRLSHLTSGGQHGQESKEGEGEEGEERSEEDCEEDPQGLQEEVTRLDLIAGDFLPARHLELIRGELNSPQSPERRKEGVGETSGQTAGSNFEEAYAPIEAGPAEEDFLRTVRMAFHSQCH